MLRMILTLAALLIAVPIYAQTPEPKPSGYQAAGSPAAARRQVLTAADTATALTLSDERPACFAFGSLVVLKAKGGEVVGVYSMTSTITFAGAVESSGALSVVDANGPDGDGAGFTLAPGESKDTVPTFDRVYRRPGARSGVCSGRQVGPGGHSRMVPCRVNGDCTEAGAGATCDTASDEAGRLQSLRAQGCAFIVVQTDTPDASITWEMQQ